MKEIDKEELKKYGLKGDGIRTCHFCGSNQLRFTHVIKDEFGDIIDDGLTEKERDEADWCNCLGYTLIRCHKCEKHWWRTDEFD